MSMYSLFIQLKCIHVMSSFGEGHSLFETRYKIYSCVINRGILSRGSPHVTAEKKKVELSVNLQPRCGILESGYISLVDYITSMAIKASMEMVDFCRFVSREFCSSPVSKFCLP